MKADSAIIATDTPTTAHIALYTVELGYITILAWVSKAPSPVSLCIIALRPSLLSEVSTSERDCLMDFHGFLADPCIYLLLKSRRGY